MILWLISHKMAMTRMVTEETENIPVDISVAQVHKEVEQGTVFGNKRQRQPSPP